MAPSVSESFGQHGPTGSERNMVEMIPSATTGRPGVAASFLTTLRRHSPRRSGPEGRVPGPGGHW